MATTRKSLYTDDVYNDCINRINRLTAESQPQWGSMSVGQMLSHCGHALEVMNGRDLKSSFLIRMFKGVIRNAVVNDTPFKKNLRTHPEYLQTTEKDFEEEKSRLLAALDTFQQRHRDGSAVDHPLFGRMSEEESGWGNYKHLDHHLQQFGV